MSEARDALLDDLFCERFGPKALPPADPPFPLVERLVVFASGPSPSPRRGRRHLAVVRDAGEAA